MSSRNDRVWKRPDSAHRNPFVFNARRNPSSSSSTAYPSPLRSHFQPTPPTNGPGGIRRETPSENRYRKREDPPKSVSGVLERAQKAHVHDGGRSLLHVLREARKAIEEDARSKRPPESSIPSSSSSSLPPSSSATSSICTTRMKMVRQRDPNRKRSRVWKIQTDSKSNAERPEPSSLSWSREPLDTTSSGARVAGENRFLQRSPSQLVYLRRRSASDSMQGKAESERRSRKKGGTLVSSADSGGTDQFHFRRASSSRGSRTWVCSRHLLRKASCQPALSMLMYPIPMSPVRQGTRASRSLRKEALRRSLFLVWKRDDKKKTFSQQRSSSIPASTDHLVWRSDASVKESLVPSRHLLSMKRRPSRRSLNYRTAPQVSSVYSQSRSSSLAARVVQKSLKFTRDRIRSSNRKLNNTLCQYFCKTGTCRRGSSCPFLHDPEKRAICPKFLDGSCLHMGTHPCSCPLSHEVDAHRMPHCIDFIRSFCPRGEECPYLHVNVSRKSPFCPEFSKFGWCPRGASCNKKHRLRRSSMGKRTLSEINTLSSMASVLDHLSPKVRKQQKCPKSASKYPSSHEAHDEDRSWLEESFILLDSDPDFSTDSILDEVEEEEEEEEVEGVEHDQFFVTEDGGNHCKIDDGNKEDGDGNIDDGV